MRYAKWLTRQPQGDDPSTVLINNVPVASGMFYQNEWIVGTIADNLDISTLAVWSATELSSEQVLALAQGVNPDCFFADDGTIQAPRPQTY